MREPRQISLLFVITLTLGLAAVGSLSFFPLAVETGPPGSGVMLKAYSQLTFLRDTATLLVLVFPLILLLLYYLFGRERECTVPDYLSTVPDPAIKPWIVNLLFAGDPLDFDENGFYATVLDLQRRGIIRMERGPGGEIRIRFPRQFSGDEYENRVIGFLMDLAGGNVVDTSPASFRFGLFDFDHLSPGERIKLSKAFRTQVLQPVAAPVGEYLENGLQWVLLLGSLGILIYIASFFVADTLAGFFQKLNLIGVITALFLAFALRGMWQVREKSRVETPEWMETIVYVMIAALLLTLPFPGNEPTPVFILILVILIPLLGMVVFALTGRGAPIHRISTAFLPFSLVIILGIFPAAFLLLSGGGGAPALPVILLSLVVVLQTMVAMAFPATLFGRWKGNNYELRCRWDAFRGFLSDLAMIRNLPPEELPVWGEWLVYGTALGVGDGVIGAMKDMKIESAEAETALSLREGFAPLTGPGGLPGQPGRADSGAGEED